MDNFITDALRWKTGTDIAISNGFRFSPPINVEKMERQQLQRVIYGTWSLLMKM